MLTSVGRDRICVVRAVAGASDTLAHRRVLERAMAPASLRPRGLPPRTIVCVRRLQMSGDGLGAHQWTARVESRVEQATSGAARPFWEIVPANANAVLFLDETEMLACLARDWRDAGAWWWRGLLGRDADAQLVHERLRDAPTLVPSVLSLLAERGAVSDVLRAMPAELCAALSHQVVRAFTLPGDEEHEVVSADTATVVAQVSTTWREEQHVMRALRSVLVSAHCLDVINTLDGDARQLLVRSLLVTRAPALARAASIGSLLVQWDAWHQSAHATTFAESFGMGTTEPVAAIRASSVMMPATPSHVARQDNRRHAADITPRDHAAQRAVVAPASSVARRATNARIDAIANVAAPTPASLPTPPTRAEKPPVDSSYAGVFYLVNVLLHMGLYADFANPSRASIPMPIGDLLALIAERYCGADVRRDAIWLVLATIAGRRPEQAPRRTLGTSVRRRDVRAFERWFTPVLTRMEARMASALAMLAEDTFAFLCTQRGAVVLTGTRLDVHFPLATHPLAIRLAGIDRDPGWVPAAARVIAFHYDEPGP